MKPGWIGRLFAGAWLMLVLGQGSAQGSAATGAPAAPPAEVFFGEEEFGNFDVSSSGRWLAVTLQPAKLRRGIAVYDLHGKEPPREVARFSDIDVGRVQWVGDDRLVFWVYNQLQGSGDQHYYSGLFSVRPDGSELQQHIRTQWLWAPPQGTRTSRRLDATHRLAYVPQVQTPGAESVIVYGARTPGRPDSDWVLKRLDLVSLRVQSLDVAAPEKVVNWQFDGEGNPVIATTRHAGQLTVHERQKDAQGAYTREWRVLLKTSGLTPAWTVDSTDLDGRLYVSEPQGPAGEHVLKRFDRASGKPEAQALVAVPGFDFDGELLQERPGEPLLGVRVLTESATTVWLDAGMAALQKSIDARLPDRTNTLHCRRCREAGRTVVVSSRSDRHPGEIWLWRGEADQPSVWRRIAVRRPAVDPRQMAEVAFTRFAARDGLQVPLWVTLPPAATAATAGTAGPAPAVVLVHGGPWTRGGSWAWSAIPQFLASRGYVVLEPEFRGSTGFGRRHEQAGWKQWGRAMQDDLADAVAWAAERGLVDRQRVCIVGGSYGGYAALMGLVRQQEVFRCAAAFVPVTDLEAFLREGSPDDRRDEYRPYDLPVMIADRHNDAELVRQNSPLAQAERIRAPLLLAWGEEDTRVPPAHAERMRDALRAAGREPEWVAYHGEGHSWLKLANWLDFAGRLERLLARELKPASGPAGSTDGGPRKP